MHFFSSSLKFKQNKWQPSNPSYWIEFTRQSHKYKYYNMGVNKSCLHPTVKQNKQ